MALNVHQLLEINIDFTEKHNYNQSIVDRTSSLALKILHLVLSKKTYNAKIQEILYFK